jgi:hypothetical protein
MVGKTNTPEFGAGLQTFNSVFGATRNPYDLTKTCGGTPTAPAGLKEPRHERPVHGSSSTWYLTLLVSCASRRPT